MPKAGSKTDILVFGFVKIAEQNNGIVTSEQAKILNPKYPNDTAYYARKAGWEVTTDRKNKLYKVGKYVHK